MLGRQRLTESQLWTRLIRRGYEPEEVRSAVARCKAEGYLDDALFARLFVEGRVKAVGDARLVAELVRRGVDRETARANVAAADRGEGERLAAAAAKLFRTRPTLSYPSAARALERLGFPTPAIYRYLRRAARAQFDPSIEDYGAGQA